MLKQAPALQAKFVFEWLHKQKPDRYEPGQLRSLQRGNIGDTSMCPLVNPITIIIKKNYFILFSIVKNICCLDLVTKKLLSVVHHICAKPFTLCA
jgi:hypothetical protein